MKISSLLLPAIFPVIFPVILLMTVLASQASSAETISATRIRSLNRLLPPTKLTVGPDDQYFAAPSPDGKILVFTRKADLVAQLQVQDRTTGEVRDLLPANADSQEATFSPDGRLAFSYFRFNARGDICWAKPATARLETLRESDIRCLKRTKETSAHQRSNPFWRGAKEIGFLERAIGGQAAKVISENIESGVQTTLAEGKLWSPSMRPGGRYLVYNKWIDGNEPRRMVVKDLAAGGSEHIIRLGLPGISGFPILSEDEKFLYFSHFINDTNADRMIDGSDNAVVFRLKVEEVLAASKKQATRQEVFPEQLTSVEMSCSFPVPFADSVFETCAFEGSLDIYQMPTSGVVPGAWSDKLLANALDTARSYQDRILLLNTQKYRQVKAGAGKLDERLLVDHVLSGDVTAARFYLERLEGLSVEQADKQYYQLLDIYLRGRQLKQQQPTSEVTREFRAKLLQEDAKIARLKAPAHFKNTVHAWFREFLDEPKAASDFLKKVRFEGSVRPLERMIYFDLAEKAEVRGLQQALAQAPAHSSAQALTRLTELYRAMFMAPEFAEQAKLFYAFSYLRRLTDTVKSKTERVQWIERANQGVPESVALLFNSELAVLKIIETPNKTDKYKAYAGLDKFFIASKSDYFLRRAVYVRAITNFADALEFQFMGFVGDNWLKYTANDDTEFAFAREFIAVSSLDRAYDSMAAKNLELASSYFYQAVSTTDDLEGHWGYVQVMAKGGKRALIDVRYQALQSQNLVADNMKFVRAAIALVDGETEAARDPKYVKHLEQALAQLKTMQTDRDSAVRHLLMGYCLLEKLLRTANGFEFDSSLFQEAHRALMLAYDLGRENDRIKASALMNLGILHSRAQNFGLASRFFQLRKRLEFISDLDRAHFAWLAARALEFSHQPALAAEELARVPGGVRNVAIDERQAYELAFAEKFQESAALYHKILSAKKITGSRNLAAAHLTNGYALLKAKRSQEARVSLEEAKRHASELTPSKRSAEQYLDFEPMRMRLVASGLLAQASESGARVAALEERGRLIESAKGLVEDWQTLRIQNHLQLADALGSSDHARATLEIKAALHLTEEYGDKNQYLGNAVFRATVGGLVYAMKYPASFSQDDVTRVTKLTERSLATYGKLTDSVAMMQRLKLQLLKIGFSRKHLGYGTEQARADVEKLLASPEAQTLKIALPQAGWNELTRLAEGVQLF